MRIKGLAGTRFWTACFLAGGVLSLPVVPACAVENVPPLEIFRTGDTDMNCHQIAGEIARMDSVIMDSQETEKDSRMASTGVGVAKAVGGFLIGSLTGTIGIMAAGHLVAHATDGKADDAENLLSAAAQRRSMMIGIFNAKKCQGPLFSTMDSAAAAAAIEPAAGSEITQTPSDRVRRYND